MKCLLSAHTCIVVTSKIKLYAVVFAHLIIHPILNWRRCLELKCRVNGAIAAYLWPDLWRWSIDAKCKCEGSSWWSDAESSLNRWLCWRLKNVSVGSEEKSNVYSKKMRARYMSLLERELEHGARDLRRVERARTKRQKTWEFIPKNKKKAASVVPKIRTRRSTGGWQGRPPFIVPITDNRS